MVLYNSSWYAYNCYSIRNIFDNHTPCTYYRISPDSDAILNYYTSVYLCEPPHGNISGKNNSRINYSRQSALIPFLPWLKWPKKTWKCGKPCKKISLKQQQNHLSQQKKTKNKQSLIFSKTLNSYIFQLLINKLKFSDKL